MGEQAMTPEQKRRRLLLLVALVLAGGTFAFLAFGNIGENLVYYWSPSELVEAGDGAYGASIRLGGLVEPDSVVRGDDGLTLSFSVTDGKQSVPVRAQAVPPAMFREGIGVVLEGRYQPEGFFETDRLMVKHDNEYRAPDHQDERDMQELIESLQVDT
jgi:cytochrome c-type biogenesis protein CcmE